VPEGQRVRTASPSHARPPSTATAEAALPAASSARARLASSGSWRSFELSVLQQQAEALSPNKLRQPARAARGPFEAQGSALPLSSPHRRVGLSASGSGATPRQPGAASASSGEESEQRTRAAFQKALAEGGMRSSTTGDLVSMPSQQQQQQALALRAHRSDTLPASASGPAGSSTALTLHKPAGGGFSSSAGPFTPGLDSPLPQARLPPSGNVLQRLWGEVVEDIRANGPRWAQGLAIAVGLQEEEGGWEGGGSGGGSGNKSVALRLWERWRPAAAEWLPHYSWRKHLSRDVVAGITIGVLLIPQGLAYSVLAGLPPVYGVYTGIPSIVYAIFGTSRHAAIGPMSLPALLMATAVSDLRPASSSLEEYTGQVMALTFMCGLLLFVMGWLNLGFVVRFISQPVLSGFTSAAAIMTMVSVMKDMLGAPVPRAQVLQGYVTGIVDALPSTHLPTLATGLIALGLLYGLPKVKRLAKVPAALLVVVISIVFFAIWMAATGDNGAAAAAAAAASATRPGAGGASNSTASAATAAAAGAARSTLRALQDMQHVVFGGLRGLAGAIGSAASNATAAAAGNGTSIAAGNSTAAAADPTPLSYATRIGIALVGRVPSSFPVPAMPPLSRAVELLPAAVSISFVGYIESIAVAKMYAVKYGYDTNPSSELKALGLTNMFGASVAQSFLVMGAFGRSAVNESSGAKSQVSGIVGTAVVIALLLFVMPALFYLPKAVLAALIIMAVKKLINVGDFKRLWRVDKRDWLSMLAAFTATLFLGVLPGIVTAMAFSLLLFIAFTTQPQVQELGRLAGTVIYRELGQVGVSRVPDVKIVRFVAPLFFANCSVLKDRLLLELVRRKQMPPRLQWRALVLDFQSVATIDSTSVQALEEVLTETRGARLPVLVAGSNTYVETFLRTSGVAAHLGGRRFLFRRVHEAVRAVLLREVRPADVPPLPAGAAGSDGGKAALPAAGGSGGKSGSGGNLAIAVAGAETSRDPWAAPSVSMASSSSGNVQGSAASLQGPAEGLASAGAGGELSRQASVGLSLPPSDPSQDGLAAAGGLRREGSYIGLANPDWAAAMLQSMVRPPASLQGGAGAGAGTGAGAAGRPASSLPRRGGGSSGAVGDSSGSNSSSSSSRRLGGPGSGLRPSASALARGTAPLLHATESHSSLHHSISASGLGAGPAAGSPLTSGAGGGAGQPYRSVVVRGPTAVRSPPPPPARVSPSSAAAASARGPAEAAGAPQQSFTGPQRDAALASAGLWPFGQEGADGLDRGPQ
jgi:SulP family sulfate permease